MSQLSNAPAPGGAQKKENIMKKNPTLVILAAQACGLPTLCALATLALSACNTPVSVSGDYSTPKEKITGAVNATTNGITVSGGYSATNQTVGGSVTIDK
jgi:hypothetical protein